MTNPSRVLIFFTGAAGDKWEMPTLSPDQGALLIRALGWW